MVDQSESRALRRANQAYREQFVTELRRLFADIGGAPALGAQLPSLSLMGWFEAKHSLEVAAARRRLANDRAGIAASSPGEPSVWDRYIALRAGRGALFEDILAAELGRARARELRAIDDGWPGARVQIKGKCPGEGSNSGFGIAGE